MTENGARLRVDKPMAVGWQVLEQALTNPRTGRLEDIAQVAEDTGVSEDLMYRWLRRPSRKSDPNATGRRNPIDYVLRLIRAVYLISPWGARLIVKCILSEFARLEANNGRTGPLMVAWPAGSQSEKDSETDGRVKQ